MQMFLVMEKSAYLFLERCRSRWVLGAVTTVYGCVRWLPLSSRRCAQCRDKIDFQTLHESGGEELDPVPFCSGTMFERVEVRSESYHVFGLRQATSPSRLGRRIVKAGKIRGGLIVPSVFDDLPEDRGHHCSLEAPSTHGKRPAHQAEDMCERFCGSVRCVPMILRS